MDLEIWERQPDEGPEAYAGFSLYRDMDPVERNYPAVAKILGVSVTIAHRNGSKHHWIERAAAWDFHLERARLQQTENYQQEMAARHAKIAMLMLDKVRERLRRLSWSKLDPKLVAQWLDVGVKVERLSRGLTPEEASKAIAQVNLNFRSMSEQEIMAELARENRRMPVAARARAAVLDVPTKTEDPTSGRPKTQTN